MKKGSGTVVVLFLWALLASCSVQASRKVAVDDHTVDIFFKSPSIAKNMIGDASTGNIRVLLPPGYATSGKRYPAVYFLHGYGDSIYQLSGYYRIFEDAMKSGASREFIIVNVNGTNKLGGSFYDNSPVIGNWRDFVVKEVVPLVDKTFRTEARSESRGIAGFSMGGYGALNIAFLHPDVFGSLWVLGPGLVKDGEISSMLAQWNSSIRTAYASIYAYDVSLPEPWVLLPTQDGSAADNEILAKWYRGYGDIAGKVDRYAAQKKHLDAISVNWGKFDSYQWLARACVTLDETLSSRAIPHEAHEWDIGHSLSPQIMLESMLPFFSKNLK